MFNANNSVGSLVTTFGQNKPIIHQYYEFIAIGIVKVFGKEWLSLPNHDTDEYLSLLGAGVFTHSNGDLIFNNTQYIQEMTTVAIQRPTVAQGHYYNGHKKDILWFVAHIQAQEEYIC